MDEFADGKAGRHQDEPVAPDDHARGTELAGALFSSPAAFDHVLGLSAAEDLGRALRDMVKLAHAHAPLLDEGSVEEQAERDAPDVPESTREAVAHLFSAGLSSFEAMAEQLDVSTIDEANALADPVAFIASSFDLARTVGQMGQGAAELAGAHGAEEYLIAFALATNRASREQLLLRSIYSTSFTLIESAVVAIARREAMTQSRLGMFSTEVDRVVRSTTRGGPNNWGQHFQATFGWDPTVGLPHWADVLEFSATRNLFVHRRGVVDEAFATAVRNSPPPGTMLELTVEATNDAVDLAEATARLLRGVAWIHSVPDVRSQLVSVNATTHTLIALRARRNVLAENLASWSLLHADNEEVGALARVNAWLARARRLGSDAVREEVSEWAPGELGRQFELARMCLLEEWDGVLALVAEMRALGEWDSSMATWPVLEPIRVRL